MDYQKIYQTFIADRKNKENDLLAYGEIFEKHHIVPKSLGGSNKKSNLICLTPSDHFFAHELLAKIYGGPMWSALFFMAQEKTTSAFGVKVTHRTYGMIRSNFLSNLPDHIKNVGSYLLKNQKRVEGLKKYHSSGMISGMVKARYEDQSYRDKWIDGQKKSWNDARKNKMSQKVSLLWQDPSYVEKMKKRTSPNAWTSEQVQKKWKDPAYLEKMKSRAKSKTVFQKGHGGRSVVNLDTNEIFPSATEAAIKIGKNRNAVSNAIGKGTKCGGSSWAYIEGK